VETIELMRKTLAAGGAGAPLFQSAALDFSEKCRFVPGIGQDRHTLCCEYVETAPEGCVMAILAHPRRSAPSLSTIAATH
jgi:hypothetical protein